MKYFFSIFIPPLAIILCGKPWQAFLNVILCCIGWFPAVIHAVVVVNNYNADPRNEELIRAIKQARQFPR
ncbi:Proteolipid membrane potential modulator [compost metagenome]